VISFFISPHGFGHAARGSAVIESLYDVDPLIRFDIFTSVPEWFFIDSLSASFRYHDMLTDIGLVQKSAFQEDIDETLRYLDGFLPFGRSRIVDLADRLKRSGAKLVVCDISPMGILAAKQAGIPSVLVENFTWDWIYQGYVSSDTRMEKHIDYLKEIFRSADYHVQAEPACDSLPADLIVKPVSRKVRTRGDEIRARLGIPAGRQVVLITTGGIPETFGFIDRLRKISGASFIFAGSDPGVDTKPFDNIISLPFHSDFYHPDLVSAADAVVGKVGYSTLSEVYHAGVPFGYISRLNFCESDKLVAYIQKHMAGIEIAEKEFRSGDFLSKLDDLLSITRVSRSETNGADQIAGFIADLL
jgi:UDP-N-acetylglucosamine:LPS N-acetylglucosamine transferase